MADLNTQVVVVTSSGLLSAQKGPGGVGFPANDTTKNRPRVWRVVSIKAVKTTGSGSWSAFDATSAQVAPSDEICGGDITEHVHGLGVTCKSGDIYFQITGSWKLYVYLDLNN